MKKRPIAIVALLALIAGSTTASAQLISEFEPNPDGSDPTTQNFELSGAPSTSFSGYLISIECDGANGTVDRAAAVSGSFDADGLLVVSVPDLENPSFTVMLTSEFTGTVGTTDIDTNDDGVADNLGNFGTIYDAIGVPDAATDESALYGADVGGTDFAYTGAEPQIIFCDFSAGPLYAVNVVGDTNTIFDTSGANVSAGSFIFGSPELLSFGTLNPSTTVPVELQSFSIE